MGKYDPLEAHLSNSVEDECTLTHKEIEDIIGSRLPKTAKTKRQWWRNEVSGSHVRIPSWMRAGWKVVDGCEPQNGRVRLERTIKTTESEILSARLQATQMLLLLVIPRVARHDLVSRLIEVTTELAEGRGPRNKWFKHVQKEAIELAKILENVDHFESLVEKTNLT